MIITRKPVNSRKSTTSTVSDVPTAMTTSLDEDGRVGGGGVGDGGVGDGGGGVGDGGG